MASFSLIPERRPLPLQKTDDYFIEAGNAAADFTIADTSAGKEIALKSSVAIPADSTTSQIKGVGYILTISTSASGDSAPAITSALSATGTIGAAFNYQITAYANGPTSFNAAGLPAGLTVNTVTGLISGTPTTAGIASVTISAANASGAGMKDPDVERLFGLRPQSGLGDQRSRRATAGQCGSGRNGLHIGFKPRRFLQRHRRPKRGQCQPGRSLCPRPVEYRWPSSAYSTARYCLLYSLRSGSLQFQS